MKNLIVALTIAAAFIYTDVDAQKVNKGKYRHSGIVSVDSTREKTLDDGTVGVMYKDTIRSSAKGSTRNMNYNTNVNVPPADGGNNTK